MVSAEVIELSDDDDVLIEAARRSSDQTRQQLLTIRKNTEPPKPVQSETLNPDSPEVVILEQIKKLVKPTNEILFVEIPEKNVLVDETPRSRPNSGGSMKRTHDRQITSNAPSTSKAADVITIDDEEDIQFVQLVSRNKTAHEKKKTQNVRALTSKYNKYRNQINIKSEILSPTKNDSQSQDMMSPSQQFSSQLASMAPRPAAATTSRERVIVRRSLQSEKMLTINRTYRGETNSPIQIIPPTATLIAPVNRERDKTPERTADVGIEESFSLINFNNGTPEHSMEDEWDWDEPSPSYVPARNLRPKPASRSPFEVSEPPLREIQPQLVDQTVEKKKTKCALSANGKSEEEKVKDFWSYLKWIQRVRSLSFINGNYAGPQVQEEVKEFSKQELRNYKAKAEAAWLRKIRKPIRLNEKLKTLVRNDISKGREKVPIPAYTYTENKDKPKFKYMTQNRMVEPLSAEGHDQWKICCSCVDGCGLDCECIKASINGGAVIADKYIITANYSDFYNSFAVACGPECACQAKCTNTTDKVMDQGNFELFCRNDDFGYGVRAKRPIEANTLLCEFVGEKITQSEHERRNLLPGSITLAYTFRTYDKPEAGAPEDYFVKIVKSFCTKASSAPYTLPETTFIDPSVKGNIGRFFGHSEYPNMTQIRIITNDARPEAARLFFYSTMPLRKGEELYIDYGGGYQIPKCLCDHICCGDSGKHLWLQAKTRALRMLDQRHDDISAEIKDFVEEEKKRIASNPSEFNLCWQKTELMRSRARQALVPKATKKAAPKRKNKKKACGRQDQQLSESNSENKENCGSVSSSGHFN